MGTAIPMLDLMFFLTENQDNPRHVGAVLIFQRPPRGGTRAVERIVAAYRRARPVRPFNLVPVLLRAGLPEWQEVERFDMDWHVQERRLPAPGSDAQLNALVAQLHEPMLARDRPGWQVFLIDGLERHRFALYVKVHHSLVDGESGIELLHRSLSSSARGRRIGTVVETALPATGGAGRRGAVSQLERDLERAVRGLLSVGRGSGRLLQEGVSGLRGYAPGEIRPFTAPLTPMNDPIRRGRAISHLVLPLASMKAVAKAWDATVNDVALCMLDAGMNRYLRELGRPADRELVAICPVSLQRPEAKRASTQVSVFWTPLGTPSASIPRRMRQIVDRTRTAKQRIRSLPRDVAYAYAVLSFALGEGLALLPRGSFDFFLPSNVLISNVRGPAEPLYLAGARLEALYPVSTLISGMGLNITLMSYAGKVVIGYTCNASALPDAERLARHSREAFAALERRLRS